MTRLTRDPAGASEQRYDLIVIGGGIYGAALTLEAARRGLKPLLLERDDFGGATTWNSLRIIHGGLRYLQRLDLKRHRESVAERQWFLRHFPDLVHPLACLMPLYGQGLRRPAVMRLALAINDGLSRRRNDGLDAPSHLPDGRILGRDETIALFPRVDREGLRGAALWHDAVMPCAPRIVIEMLRWAVASGAVCLNYVEATALQTERGRTVGVEAANRADNGPLRFSSPVVVNCAGPWCRDVGRRFDRDVPALFQPSLAFNLLLDREPLSSAALAVAAKRPGARTYFLVPWKGRILAGTYHAPCSSITSRPTPTKGEITRMIADLKAAIPKLDLGTSDVLRVHAGLLPASAPGTERLAVREKLVAHETVGGPRGLFSVSGVKFTTARRVAEKTLALMRPGSQGRREAPPRPTAGKRPYVDWLADPAEHKIVESFDSAVRDEAVVHLDDFFFRRGDGTERPEAVRAAVPALCRHMGWHPFRSAQESDRVLSVLEIDALEPRAPSTVAVAG